VSLNLACHRNFDKLFIAICDQCLSVLNNLSLVKPPKFAISNGNWIGALPEQFAPLRWLEEQTVALHLPYSYICKLWKDVGTNVLKSHAFVVKNPTSFAEMVPGDVTGKTRITLVGAFTQQEKVEVYNRYEWNLPLARDFVAFLRENNATYSAAIEPFDLPKTSEAIIDDCSYDSAHPISEEVLSHIKFASTSYASMSENENERYKILSTQYCEN
jgi:hypothetical protein